MVRPTEDLANTFRNRLFLAEFNYKARLSNVSCTVAGKGDQTLVRCVVHSPEID